jgi:hypothetical protein
MVFGKEIKTMHHSKKASLFYEWRSIARKQKGAMLAI